MRRFRRWFLLFALALLAPMGLLVERAVRSISLERQVQHQAVAERVFDEMERSLSGFLETAETRSFDEFLNDPSTRTETFLLGSFQLGPDDRVEARPNTATTIRLEELEDAARALSDSERREPPKAKSARPLPGTTVPLINKEERPGASLGSPPAPASSFDAFRALNKAASDRLQRQRKLEDSAAQAPAAAFEEAVRDTRRNDAPEKQADRADVYLPPWTAQRDGSTRLVLRRAILQGGQVIHQGFVVEVPELCGWLKRQSIGDYSLAQAMSLECSTIATGDPSVSTADERYVYQHRFADPFDDITARLVVPRLPGVGGVTYVYALAGLLLLTGTLGLAALYRMVIVSLRYAEQRSNFAAAVTHELKTPLTAIRLYGEMLRDGLVPSEVKRDEYHRHITSESERLTRLIDNVLELSRLEKGSRPMTLTLVPLQEIANQLVDLLRPHLTAEGFAISIEAPTPLPPIQLDRDATIQILTNLVDNALKYGRDSNDKRIELRCFESDGSVSIAVRDHGPGVTTQHLGKLFEPFYRGEDELTRRHRGTGIGLALVRGLAERMGARVTARNHPQGGFEVTIAWCTT